MKLRRIINDFDRMGGEIYYRKEKYAHDPELMEAYECGLRDGWREAMEETEDYYERRGGVTHLGGSGRILYRRDTDHEKWDDGIEYRRRRNSRGEFM